MAINLFLDTSVLPRNPAKMGPGHHALVSLVQVGELRVWVAELAVREWRSQLSGAVREAAAEVAKLQRGVVGSIEAVGEQLGELRQSLLETGERLVGEQLDAYLALLRAEVVPATPETAESVWNRYFAGAPPFAASKSRKDLPDAFIYEAALTCLARPDGEPLHCLVADGRFREELAKLDGVLVYESTKEFLGSDAAKSMLRSLQQSMDWLAAWDAILDGVKSCERDYLEKLDEAVFETIPGETVGHADEWGLLYVSEAIDEMGKYEFVWEDAESVSPGWVTVPFSGELTVHFEVEPHMQPRPVGVTVHGSADIKLEESAWRDGQWGAGVVEVELEEVST